MAKSTGLNPIELLQTIRTAQQELVALADYSVAEETEPTGTPTLERFLEGLRTAWRDGEIRPTSQPKPKAPRGRRRPDPFAAVTAALREWFEAEPRRTSGELFERLRQENPGAFADEQQRTLQRRLKMWRSEMAQKLVFGDTATLSGVAPEAQPIVDLLATSVMGLIPDADRCCDGRAWGRCPQAHVIFKAQCMERGSPMHEISPIASVNPPGPPGLMPSLAAFMIAALLVSTWAVLCAI